MNWQHQTIITPIALAEPARAACMARLGLTMVRSGRVEHVTGLPVDF